MVISLQSGPDEDSKMNFHHLHTVNYNHKNNTKDHKCVCGKVKNIPTLRPKFSLRRVAPRAEHNDVKNHISDKETYKSTRNKNYLTKKAIKMSLSKVIYKRYKVFDVKRSFSCANHHHRNNHNRIHSGTRGLNNNLYINHRPKPIKGDERSGKEKKCTSDYSEDKIRSPCSILSLQRNTYRICKSRKKASSRARLYHKVRRTDDCSRIRKKQSDALCNSKNLIDERRKIRRTRRSTLKTCYNCNPCFSKICQVPSTSKIVEHNNTTCITGSNSGRCYGCYRSRCIFCDQIKPCLEWFCGRMTTVIKYSLFILAFIVWLPCIIAVVICWVITYPLRPNADEKVRRSSDCKPKNGNTFIFIIKKIANLCNPVLNAFNDVYSLLQANKPITKSKLLSCKTVEDGCFSIRKIKSGVTALSNSKNQLLARRKIHKTRRCKLKTHYNCSPCFGSSRVCQVPSVMMEINKTTRGDTNSVRCYRRRCVLCGKIKPWLHWFCGRIKTVIKYSLFILIFIVSLPCIIAVVLCWLITYPLRPNNEKVKYCSNRKYTNGKISHTLMTPVANLWKPVLNAFNDVYSILEIGKQLQPKSPIIICQSELPPNDSSHLKCSRFQNNTPNPINEKTYRLINENDSEWVIKPTLDGGDNNQNFSTEAVKGSKKSCTCSNTDSLKYEDKKSSNNKKNRSKIRQTRSHLYNEPKYLAHVEKKSIADEKHFVISENKTQRIRNNKLFLDSVKQHDSPSNQRNAEATEKKITPAVKRTCPLPKVNPPDKLKRSSINTQTCSPWNSELKYSPSIFIDNRKCQDGATSCLSCNPSELNRAVCPLSLKDCSKDTATSCLLPCDSPVHYHSLYPSSQNDKPCPLPLQKSNYPKRRQNNCNTTKNTTRSLRHKVTSLRDQLQYWLKCRALGFKSEIIETDKEMWPEDESTCPSAKSRKWRRVKDCCSILENICRIFLLIITFCIWFPIFLLLFLCWIICCQFL